VDPLRSTSASSMQAPPGPQRVQQVSTFLPGRVMAGTAAAVDQLVDDRLDAQALGERGGQQ
jgi:hypothetical protein